VEGHEGGPPDGEGAREIAVTPRVRVRLDELRLSPLRSGGPGGQNVNKVSNGVELRWSLEASAALDAGQKAWARARLGRRINAEGELILRAVEFRERPRNVDAVLKRFAELLAEALHRDPTRRPTRPTRGANRRRREAKSRRSDIKRGRRGGPEE
jgi:ribosome-associated protein